ncbi:MAG: MarR family transcriptional regulator [Sphingobium sp.]
MNESLTDTNPPTLAGAGTDELRLWVRLLRCAKVGEKLLRRNFEEQFDTTLPRFDVMAVLYREPDGMSMGSLSRALLVSNGNVTSIVRQLQAQGLLQSIPHPQDGRSAIVSLTLAGRAQFVVLAEAHHAWISEIFREVPADRLKQLVEGLGELHTILGA